MDKITSISTQNASADANIVAALGINLAKEVFALHGVNGAGDITYSVCIRLTFICIDRYIEAKTVLAKIHPFESKNTLPLWINERQIRKIIQT